MNKKGKCKEKGVNFLQVDNSSQLVRGKNRTLRTRGKKKKKEKKERIDALIV